MYQGNFKQKGRSYGPQRQYRGSGRSRRFQGQKINHERYISEAVESQVDSVYTSTDNHFSDLNILPVLKNNIIKRKFTQMTQIQNDAIPHLINGRDLLGLATTGSGKTGAFLIPLINKALKDQTQYTLIVAPTRELASQIQNEFRLFAEGTNLRDVVLIGGASMYNQINILRRNPRFVIATPGRLKDLSKRNHIDLTKFNNIVLDEVDQMLDMGFVHDIKLIISMLSKNKQVMFFSATMNSAAEAIANSILVNPIKVEVKSKLGKHNVEQNIVKTGGKDKTQVLSELLARKDFEKVLVFSRTKHGADKLSYELRKLGHKADCIHGNKSQGARSKVLHSFKVDQIKVLVATDVAARGIDVPDISHVINFDEPENYSTYLHRIGRTGRIGKKGCALTFVN